MAKSQAPMHVAQYSVYCHGFSCGHIHPSLRTALVCLDQQPDRDGCVIRHVTSKQLEQDEREELARLRRIHPTQLRAGAS